MAVIVSNGPTSLATANGFYRAEAFNLGMFSTTDLALGTTRTIAVTFANAGACQGLILALVAANPTLTANLKSVVVTLQENVASVWTDRATVTLSAATIANNVTTATSSGWIVPFTGGTFPYTVTTAASTWRFQVSQTGAQSANWSIRTSDATNPFYVTWCDNALTFASNDVVICKDVVTIDQTATFKGVLGTGETTRSVCAVICRSTTPAPSTVANMVWQNPAGGAYTLTLDGLLVMGAHSGFRAGTEANPMLNSARATISIIAATSGTATESGFTTVEHGNFDNQNRQSLFLIGEYPSTMVATLNATAATGQPNIVTTTTTGWALNDRVAVGGYAASGMGEATIYTVSSSVTTTVTLTTNLATTNRLAQGRVIKLNGYGVNLTAPTTGINNRMGYVSNWQLRGVLQQHCNWEFAGPASVVSEDTANRGTSFVEYCGFELSASYARASSRIFTSFIASENGTPVANNVFANCNIGDLSVPAGSASGATTFSSNVVIRQGTANGASFTVPSAYTGAITNNVFEGSNNTSVTFGGTGATISGNRFWGMSATGLTLSSAFNCTLSQNSYNNCGVGLRYSSTVIGCTDTDSTFGNLSANTACDIATTAAGYVNTTMSSQTGNVTIGTSLDVVTNLLPGSHLRFAEFNNTTNDDRGYLKYGNYQRTGSGLTDTTVRTAGGFTIRLAPNSGTNMLAWPNLVSERAVPTGNVQSRTMTVTAWVYINNAAFYAGTHTKPTLSVKYDNTTTASAVATATAGSWQQLAVTFTPTTTYGQIEVWFSGATDATGANAYFYVDDVQVAYPAGVSINLGGLDLWANATPVWPPIATFPSLGSVWDEPTAAHAVAGSFGAALSSGSGGGGGATAEEIWTHPSRTLVPVGGVTNLY